MSVCTHTHVQQKQGLIHLIYTMHRALFTWDIPSEGLSLPCVSDRTEVQGFFSSHSEWSVAKADHVTSHRYRINLFPLNYQHLLLISVSLHPCWRCFWNQIKFYTFLLEKVWQKSSDVNKVYLRTFTGLCEGFTPGNLSLSAYLFIFQLFKWQDCAVTNLTMISSPWFFKQLNWPNFLYGHLNASHQADKSY